MGKLEDHAEEEYKVIRAYLAATEEVYKYQPRGPLRSFSEAIRSDLKRTLELHSDKNNIKRTYYKLRDVVLTNEGRQEMVQEMQAEDGASQQKDISES